ncbi:MAG: hypothetical protein GTO49_34440, partial [Anaerolineae bacterium]|nr:hypothetical protein [Anaerolineae bacterium]
MRLDRLLGAGDVDPHAFAEQIWRTINNNILEFSMEVDADRYHLVRYENLVREPEKEMRRLCAFLDIPFEEQVLNPYEGNRMTDGVYSTSLSIGDPNFLHHDAIDASLGEAWKAVNLPRLLTSATRR